MLPRVASVQALPVQAQSPRCQGGDNPFTILSFSHDLDDSFQQMMHLEVIASEITKLC